MIPPVTYVCVPDALWNQFTSRALVGGMFLRKIVTSPSQAPRYNLDNTAVPSRHVEPGELSERELQVLACMADGHTNEEIGQVLYLALETVKSHTRRLYKKLGARDRAHAVHLGHRSGVLK